MFFLDRFDTAPEVPWSENYKQEDINALWATLKRLYGGEAAAAAAVKANNQVLCPLYSTPATLTSTYNSLKQVIGSEKEAREIMALNPAVLTCGDLSGEDPDEIRKVANARRSLDGFARFLQGN